MNIFRNASIKVKLAVLASAAVMIALVLSTSAFLFNYSAQVRKSKQQEVASIAEVLASNSTAVFEFEDHATAEELLASLKNQPSIETAVLYDAGGNVFATYPVKLDRAGIAPCPEEVGEWFTDDGFLDVSCRVENEEAAAGDDAQLDVGDEFGSLIGVAGPVGTLVIRSNLSEIEQQMSQVVQVALAVLVTSLLISLAIAWPLQRIITRPIGDLLVASQRIGELREYTFRVTKRGNDELGTLCDAFNAMLEQLHEGKLELERANDELEQRVAERTADLEHAMEKANAANKAKSDFLANMSHELRTPMTAILGYAEILLEDDRLSDESRHKAETVLRNGRHLLAIVNDILDMSKIEAGKMTTEKIECGIADFLSDTQSMIRPKAIEKNLKLTITNSTELPEKIKTDPTRLKQILANLLGNAIKFTEKGEISIDVSLRKEEEQSLLQFVIKDTGVGMSAGQLSKVFRPFTQADETMTRRFGGTGLGLSISRALARLLGGDIAVESTKGKGSEFTVTICTGDLSEIKMMKDWNNDSVPEKADETLNVPERVEGRILLVEDGLDNQRLISFLLKKAGAEVVTAENGAVGRDLARQALEEDDPFGVIFMDMQMPILDGYQATSQLREGGYTGAIVALTAHAMTHERQKCIDAGCDDYFTKPVDRRQLLCKASQWMHRGSPTYAPEPA